MSNESEMVTLLRQIWSIQDSIGIVDGHVSADSHIHLHRHNDELFFAGSEGVQNSVNEADQDLVFRNPANSGNTVEIVYFNVTTSIGYETEQWYNVTYPETGGTPDGTEITPWCLSDHTVTANFDVQHTPAGDATNLVDVGTADRQLPGAVVGGAKQNPTPFELKGADIDLSPGETLMFRSTLDSTNEDVAWLVLAAEYEQGREL